LVDALDSGSSARKGVEVQVLFWATLNHFGVRIKAISSEVAFFVFWHQMLTDASIDAFLFVICIGMWKCFYFIASSQAVDFKLSKL
jgi:hypothetical protein